VLQTPHPHSSAPLSGHAAGPQCLSGSEGPTLSAALSCGPSSATQTDGHLLLCCPHCCCYAPGQSRSNARAPRAVAEQTSIQQHPLPLCTQLKIVAQSSLRATAFPTLSLPSQPRPRRIIEMVPKSLTTHRNFPHSAPTSDLIDQNRLKVTQADVRWAQTDTKGPGMAPET